MANLDSNKVEALEGLELALRQVKKGLFAMEIDLGLESTKEAFCKVSLEVFT